MVKSILSQVSWLIINISKYDAFRQVSINKAPIIEFLVVLQNEQVIIWIWTIEKCRSRITTQNDNISPMCTVGKIRLPKIKIKIDTHFIRWMKTFENCISNTRSPSKYRNPKWNNLIKNI